LRRASAEGNLEAAGSSVTVAQDQFAAANFTNLNPPDPVIAGFVADAGGAGISGVTVELDNVAQHLVATRTTSASGSYAFRFTAPGFYTVQVVPSAGYAAQPPGDARRQDVRRGAGRLPPQRAVARGPAPSVARGPPTPSAMPSKGTRQGPANQRVKRTPTCAW